MRLINFVRILFVLEFCCFVSCVIFSYGFNLTRLVSRLTFFFFGFSQCWNYKL
ncbi:hypothetical protein AALP_AA4G089700 [Arabis alpina]|uniref:Uncharacterized protein n=1 Tax=Arabis alpina TaxID=50452 RepID=A0A087H236_ARAAL|nr:hypothetical protein AALP_AA4G089700 [Arabis alpina]